MHNKTDRKVNSFSPNRLFLMAIAPLVFPLQNYKTSTKEVSGWKQCNREPESVINMAYDLLFVGLHVQRVRKLFVASTKKFFLGRTFIYYFFKMQKP